MHPNKMNGTRRRDIFLSAEEEKMQVRFFSSANDERMFYADEL